MLNEVPREVVDHDVAIYFSEALKVIRGHLDDTSSAALLIKLAYFSFGQQQLADSLRMASTMLSMLPDDYLSSLKEGRAR